MGKDFQKSIISNDYENYSYLMGVENDNKKSKRPFFTEKPNAKSFLLNISAFAAFLKIIQGQFDCSQTAHFLAAYRPISN